MTEAEDKFRESEARRQAAWRAAVDKLIAEVRWERAHGPPGEWIELGRRVLEEYRKLEAAGASGRAYSVPNPFYGDGPAVPDHAPGWEQAQAARRLRDCKRLGGVPFGCHSGCRWRLRRGQGCPLYVQWVQLFEDPPADHLLGGAHTV